MDDFRRCPIIVGGSTTIRILIVGRIAEFNCESIYMYSANCDAKPDEFIRASLKSDKVLLGNKSRLHDESAGHAKFEGGKSKTERWSTTSIILMGYIRDNSGTHRV